MKDYKDCRNMSNFKDNIKELLNIADIPTKDFLSKMNLSKNYLYETDIHFPTLPKAVSIANYLNISLDYLCGKSLNKSTYTKTRKCENFYLNFKKIIDQQGISARTLCKDLNYSRHNPTRWKNGTFPYLQTVIEIADYLGCGIDDLLI